jgi:hypothetical protein
MPELREALEAAIEKVESSEQSAPAAQAAPPVEPPPSPSPEPPSAEPPSAEPPAEPQPQAQPQPAEQPVEQPTEPQPPAEEKDEEEPQERGQQRFSVHRAPHSWQTQEAKDAWRHVPHAARAEIIRREREVMRVLGESGQARQVAKRFAEVIRPYEARIRSTGLDPLRAVDELMKADHVLSTAAPAKKAALVAQIVKEYGVDIAELDSALAGQPSGDPVAERVEQLVQQRLQPFQSFVQQQAQFEAQRRQAEQAQHAQAVQKMAVDPRYPHFDDVREVMADLIEAAGNRGLALSLDEAYKRAIAIDPRFAVSMQGQAQAANARAQKALNASVSVGGAPNGGPAASKPGADLRSTIEAAFQQASGR